MAWDRIELPTRMTRYVRPLIGKLTLSKIKPLEIQAVYSQMLEKGLSARTVRFTHSILSSALKQAVKWQILAVNPAAMVDLPQNHRKEMKALSPQEANRFLEAARQDKWFVIFSLAISTGMRPEDYLGLQWKDIDFKNGTATVQRALVWKRTGGGWSLQEPKTSKSGRFSNWLLMLCDRVSYNQLQLTQDQIARYLGVHRPGVTLSAVSLREKGLIDYSRGNINIIDREGLEQSACECYPMIKDALLVA